MSLPSLVDILILKKVSVEFWVCGREISTFPREERWS
jgi:hypothetical protein